MTAPAFLEAKQLQFRWTTSTGTLSHITGIVDHITGMQLSRFRASKRNEGNEMMLIPPLQHIFLDGNGPPRAS